MESGFSQTSIANQLGFHKSTICRELKISIALKGRIFGIYVALNAGQKSQNLDIEKPKKIILHNINIKYCMAFVQ